MSSATMESTPQPSIDNGKESSKENTRPTLRANNNNNNNNNNPVRCCAGCGGKIIDRFLLHAVDRFWHTGCLKCSCCNVQLGDVGNSCFSKGGMILCKKDYIRYSLSRWTIEDASPISILLSWQLAVVHLDGLYENVAGLFGANGACSACGQSIPANELVMRSQSKVYHLKCFSCSTCHIQLVPGDRYTFVNGSLVCENDHGKLYKTHGPLTNTVGLRPGNKVC